MFLLEDGREHLFQWDLNRRVIVEDPTIKEVHFCNRTDECSLVVEVEETAIFADGKETTLRTANIPNIILQQPWDIRVYAVCTDGYTKVEETFKVKARTKPSDYVYTETEVLTWETLEGRINDDLEAGLAKMEETVNNALTEAETELNTKLTELETIVEDRLDEIENKGIKVDLEGYATETYVDEAIAGIKLPEGTKIEYIPANVTPQELQAIIDAKKWPILRYQDSNSKWRYLPYVGENDGCYHFEGLLADKAIHAQLDKTTGTLNFSAQKEVICPADYAKKQDLTSYATRTELNNVSSAIPTKVSQLSNDSSYATTTQLLNVSNRLPTKTSQLSNDSGFATESYVNNAVKNVSVDLTDYAKKSDIPDISGKADKEHTHSQYALKTEIPSTDGFATEKYVDDAIAAIEIPEGGGDVDLSNYYTKDETDGLISNINECDTYFFNPYEVEWQTGLKPTYASENMIEFAQRFMAGEGVSLYIAWQLPDTGDIRWFPAEIYINSNAQVCFERCLSSYDFGKSISSQSYLIYQTTDGNWRYNKGTTYTQFLPDKTYVDTAIQDALNAIGVAEGGAY